MAITQEFFKVIFKEHFLYLKDRSPLNSGSLLNVARLSFLTSNSEIGLNM